MRKRYVMWNAPKSFNRINIQILTVLILLLVVAGLIVSAFNYANVHAVFEKSYTEKVLMSNEMISSLINSEDIIYYVELMKNQDEDFKEKQIRFNEDREELFELQLRGASEEEQSAIMVRLQAFYEQTNAMKQPSYFRMLEQLKKLKETGGAKYVHIFADTGLKDEAGNTLYICIVDAEDEGGFNKLDTDFLGSMAYYESTAGEIYESKRPMSKANYYNEGPYGEMYYAYAPILDDEGNVIAVVSTEIGAEEMRSRINETMIVNTMIFGVFIVIAIMFIYYFINRFVARPLDLLTDTASKLADGDVNVYVPKPALKINNELGILANAINDMGNTYQLLVNSTFAIFDAANSGKLDVRHDLDEFSGDIAIVAKQMNDTLDVMTLFLNSVPESICIMTKHLIMLFQNNKYNELFDGIDAEMFVREILPNSEGLSKSELQKQFVLALERGETIGVWRNDMWFSVMLTETAENSVMIIAIDITDLTREKENAQAAAKAKSDFLSRMSHEMRTPMNAIIGMVKIAENTTNIEKLSHCLSTINASSNHLLGIINDVLDMSKIEAGQLTLEHEPLNLEKILIKVCSLVVSQAEQKHQKLTVQLENGLQQDYVGDELRLSQVLANLLSNAVKFTPDGGNIQISIDTQCDEGQYAVLRFSVKDTGIGITEEQIGRLFHSFEQADGSISRRFGGTGLGLAISRSIVEKMDGRIWVESEFGEGSTFSFEVKLEKALEQDEKVFGEECRKNAKILIVDEDESDRKRLQDIIVGFGLDVTAVSTKDDTMSLIRQKRAKGDSYDVIFFSLSIPGIVVNDTIFFDEMPELIDMSSVVIMTSFLEWNRIESFANQVGITHFLAKPLFKTVIFDAINSVIAQKVNVLGQPVENNGIPDLANIKVLLAEDIEINREIFKALMEDTKIEIIEAFNGKEAVEIFKENMHEFDLIFMDIQMPEMDGHEATRTIRGLENEWAKNIPILAMTANVFKEDIDACIDSGMNDHLSKPIDEKIIREKLLHYVRRR